jgi:SAM-dependent methyltransferase
VSSGQPQHRIPSKRGQRSMSIVYFALGVVLATIVFMVRSRGGGSRATIRALAQPVRVVFGESPSREICTELRTSGTPVLIEGIWASSYTHESIMEYFRREADELRTNRSLRVNRIINPDALAPETWREFTDLWHRSPLPLQQRWDVSTNRNVRRFELFSVQYADTDRESAAAIICNDLGGPRPRPAFAMLFDPQVEPRVSAGVNFVQGWFEDVALDSERLVPRSELTWQTDQVAVAYDNQVWKNPALPSFFDEYKRGEQRLLCETLERCADNNERRKVTLVEVGCGTGRALIEAAQPELFEQIEYLIGFDSSWGMLRKAGHNLRAELAGAGTDPRRRGLLERVVFCAMNAATMDLHFHEGTLQSQRDELPDTALAWQPDGASVDLDSYRESQKVFACMLNTLGVIPDHDRARIIANMVAALGVGDYLVLSVFNAQAFAEGAPQLYSQMRGVTQAQDEQYEHFDGHEAVFRVSGQPGYFSRWFSLDARDGGTGEDVTVNGMLDRVEREFRDRIELQREVIPIEEAGHFVRLKRLL